MVSARTVNLSHLAAERPGATLVASTTVLNMAAVGVAFLGLSITVVGLILAP